MLELLLCIPVMLLIFAGGLELANYLRTQSRMTALAREQSASIYRQCAVPMIPLSAAPSQQIISDIRTCMRDVLTKTDPVFSRIAGSPRAVLSLYFWNQYVTPPVQELLSQYRNPGSASSRIHLSDFDPVLNPRRNNLLRQQQFLAYAELEYEYTPLATFIGDVFSSLRQGLYAAAAF